MKRIPYIKLIVFLLLFVTFASSQTFVSGPITTNTTWESSGNDYIVTGDLVLLPNVTLTINEGVVVKFNDGLTFYVRGNLITLGTASAPVIITSSSTTPTAGVWERIFVQITQGASLSIVYTEFSFADQAIEIECCYSGGSLEIQSSTFHNNIVAIGGYGGETYTEIENCVFQNNYVALARAHKVIYNSEFRNNTYAVGQGAGSIFIYNSTFEGHTNTAIELDDGEIINCELKNNNIGIDCFFGRNALVEGCNIHDNYIGVKLDNDYGNFNSTVHNNDIYNNTLYNLENKASVSMHVENNWWGTTDTAIINAKIYDVYDDASLGMVVYVPYLNSPVTSIFSYKNPILSEFLIFQNYPNPFNPSTKIKYTVPQTSNVIVKVFDILGNEIETLVNEEKPVGTYEITWYAENLPSGIYFYWLQAGSSVETKKMVLMK